MAKKKSGSNFKNHQKNFTSNTKNNIQDGDKKEPTAVYKIKQSDELGRYLVASKKLNAGEVILKEEPLVVGPCQESKPMCIGCYTDINLRDPNSCTRCVNCSWPLCSSGCSGYHTKNGHSKEECDLISKSQLKIKDILSFEKFYYAITPFRCLVAKKTQPEEWKIIQSMESHTEERKKDDKLWKSNTDFAVDAIRNVWGFNSFTEEEIHFVCGILEVNAFEVNLPIPGAQCLRAIYPTAFLFAHDCVSNTCHSNGKEFQLIIRTMRTIDSNEMITVSYAYTLQGTIKRREHLKKTKFFSCCCKRCSDPTELGTYTSAIKCMACKEGFILPVNPLNDEISWKCNSRKCINEMEVTQINSIHHRLFSELDSINGNDIQGYEKFIKKCNSIFHENHYLILSALHCLSQLYGKIDGYLINDLTNELLERKIDICRKLIKVFEKFEPGLSKQRGILLYELQAPLMVLLRRKFQTQNIPKKEMKNKIKEVLKYLDEAFVILSKEPENTTEAQMAEAAKDGMTSLQEWLNLLL